MKKVITMVLAGFTMLGFAYTSPLYAAGMDEEQYQSQGMQDRQQMMTRYYELTDMMGNDVKGKNGEDLGQIKDFVTDSRGRLEFALLSTGMVSGKTIAVPLNALQYQETQGNGHIALDMSKDQLDRAPEFNKSDLSNPGWTQNVYSYFGVQPRWSESQSREEGSREYSQPQGGTSYGTQSGTESGNR